MTTIEQISECINSYNKFYSTLTIGQLLNLQDKLASLSYTLAEETANAKKQYNQNYFIKKISILKSNQNLIKQGSPIGKAQIESEFNNIELIQNEMNAEGDAYRYDLLLKQVNKILSAIAQRVSFAKQELQTAKNT